MKVLRIHARGLRRRASHVAKRLAKIEAGIRAGNSFASVAEKLIEKKER
ncbi:hypothetical protein [Sphingobium phenoxybenzoativorans]|nr:hypothetical protein [Sphingobium phenoxybenzoativorans]